MMSSPFTLLAIAAIVAIAAMALLWASDPRNRNPVVADAGCVALIAGLAVLYALRAEHGALGRRVAIASMMGSWGARLAVHLLYERAFRRTRDDSDSASLGVFLARALAAVCFSLPALLSAVNPDPDFSYVEYTASALWVVGFVGESTADRQRLAFITNPEHDGPVCRIGLWRFSRRVNDAFDSLMWWAYAIFASASPWGWISFVCPVAMMYVLHRRGANVQRVDLPRDPVEG